MDAWLISIGIVALAEIGDKTQIATPPHFGVAGARLDAVALTTIYFES